MTIDQAINTARKFLQSREIEFSEPINCEVTGESITVVFTAPGALDPNLVVDPPDIRVEVSMITQEPRLIYQM